MTTIEAMRTVRVAPYDPGEVIRRAPDVDPAVLPAPTTRPPFAATQVLLPGAKTRMAISARAVLLLLPGMAVNAAWSSLCAVSGREVGGSRTAQGWSERGN